MHRAKCVDKHLYFHIVHFLFPLAQACQVSHVTVLADATLLQLLWWSLPNVIS